VSTVDTPEEIEAIRINTVRSALRIEIKTGMLRSNRGRPTLALANEILGTNYKRKAQAYAELDAYVVENLGMPSRPLS
jgi:hypothetical protein